MPTTTVKVIAASGGDYSTLQAWEDDCPADLVSADIVWEGRIRGPFNESSGHPLTFGGGTTDATRFKRIKAEAGSSFTDNASAPTNALRYNTANGVSIENTNFYGGAISNNGENYVHVEGLQLLSTAAALSFSSASTSDAIFVKDCILQAAGNFGGTVMSDNAGGHFENCLIIVTGNGKSGFAGTRNHEFKNCTVICTGTTGNYGAYTDFGSITAINTAFFNFANVINNGTCTNCASDASSPPSGVTTLAYDTSTGSGFENISSGTEDFRIKSTSGLIGLGGSGGTSTDIIGTSKPQGGNYDVGVWEYVSGGGGAISGTSSLTFSSSGTLAGSGALAGSSSLSFSVSADGIAYGLIAGSTSLTFSPSGSLLGAGALAGSSALTFAPAGVLVGTGSLAGTTSLTFDLSGTLSGAAEGEVSGSTSLTFTPTGTLTGTAALSGATSLTFDPSGNLIGLQTVEISGSTSLTFALSGNLTDGIAPPAVSTGGGGPDPLRRKRQDYEWELMTARMMLRREREKLEAAKQELKAEAREESPDVADVVEIKAESAERQEDLRHLERIVSLYADPPASLAPKAKGAYIQAQRQADAAAMETLLQEVEAQQREEEEFFTQAVNLIFSLH